MLIQKVLGKLRISIRVTVVTIFIIATLVSVGAAIGLQYHFGKELAIETALHSYQQTAQHTRENLKTIDRQAEQTAQLLSGYPNLIENHWIQPHVAKLFAQTMQNPPLFYALYIGFGNGDFYELINLDSHDIIRSQVQATPEDRWAVISIRGQGQQRQRQMDYYNASFELRASRQQPSDYDARKRLWFTQAVEGTVRKTPPYQFQHLQAPGQTYSTVIPQTQAVLAVDIALSTLSEQLRQQLTTEDSEIYLFQANGELIASNQTDGLTGSHLPKLQKIELSTEQQDYIQSLPALRVSNENDWPPIDYAIGGEPKGYAIDLLRLLSRMTGLKLEFINGYSWPELVNLFENGELDILHPIVPSANNAQMGFLSDPILSLPHAIVTRDNTLPIRHLSELNNKTLAIPRGWSSIPIIRQFYPQIPILEVNSSRDALLAVQKGEAYATLDTALILRYTARQYFMDNLQFHENLQISSAMLPKDLHLLISKSRPQLVPILNLALKQISAEQHHILKERWLAAENLSTSASNVVPYKELIKRLEHPQTFEQIQKKRIHNRDYFVFLTPLARPDSSEEYFAALVPVHTLLAPILEKVSNSVWLSLILLLLLIPTAWLFASPIVTPIKALSQENLKIKNRQYAEVRPHSSHTSEIHELSLSIQEMAESLQAYEQAQKEWIESFVKLIAQAIDDKSPYTAQHCARVPQLAIMLANQAARCDEPPFKAFAFQNEDELREFRLAAWLHDCGKITTPEYIVDKGTKLETLYNRIHEIRMRFEVLWRDAELECLNQCLQRPDEQRELQENLTQKQQQLQADFAFIARCNIGTEQMAHEDIKRLRKLAKTRWIRHFDNRLGLSPMEKQRFTKSTAPLPATEYLLSDRTEHIIPRREAIHYNPAWGIQMDVPEHLYNQGELYNLSIERGTLTPEDRFKINEHVISTIKMLESLNFPPEFAKVPRYASTHHETLDGSGYPRKLSAEDLSIAERIISIADIFEALTAPDRPYKKAKPLSEALDILHEMVRQKHIDGDLFRLFIKSGVYLDYAKQFLNERQMDSIDIAKYLDE
jgi:HD-GYP domain-containing protein (c-di-GMP phosphodiesterase class II)